MQQHQQLVHGDLLSLLDFDLIDDAVGPGKHLASDLGLQLAASRNLEIGRNDGQRDHCRGDQAHSEKRFW